MFRWRFLRQDVRELVASPEYPKVVCRSAQQQGEENPSGVVCIKKRGVASLLLLLVGLDVLQGTEPPCAQKSTYIKAFEAPFKQESLAHTFLLGRQDLGGEAIPRKPF